MHILEVHDMCSKVSGVKETILLLKDWDAFQISMRLLLGNQQGSKKHEVEPGGAVKSASALPIR